MYPAVAFDGTNYLVVWDDGVEIRCARVSTAGVVLDPSGILISSAASAQQRPCVAFDGTNYLIAWQNLLNIYGARVSKAGVVLDATRYRSAPRLEASTGPVVFDGTDYLVVWTDGRSIRARTSTARELDVDGAVLDASGIAMSTNMYNQSEPAVAFDGTNYLVVWQDSRGGSMEYPDVYGARVSAGGSVLDRLGLRYRGEDRRGAVSRGGV